MLREVDFTKEKMATEVGARIVTTWMPYLTTHAHFNVENLMLVDNASCK